jgi:hypothetical protein
MKFDTIIGNPPFNISSNSSDTIAGTSGNTILYKKFIDIGFRLRNENGTISYVVQRNGVKYAGTKYNVSKYNIDTSGHWKYTTGYFISQSNNNKKENITPDQILKKVYDLFNSRSFRTAIGGSYKSHLLSGKVSDKNQGGTYGLIDCPKAFTPAIYGYINGSFLPAGPKLLFKGLESKHSYYVTDKPAYVGSACCLFFDTTDDAQRAKLFIQNNTMMRYLQVKLKEKALGLLFRYVKRFNLNQIVTGKEWPQEWNLTQEERDYIEDTVDD